MAYTRRLLKHLVNVTISASLQTGIFSLKLLFGVDWPVAELNWFCVLISNVFLGFTSCIVLGIHTAVISA